jgi:hypothetical protein
MRLVITDQIVELDEQDINYYLQGLYVATNNFGYKSVKFTRGIHKQKVLSRILLNCPDGLEVDHKDGNTLNNKRDNLRIATPSQNGANRNKANNSGYRGVIKVGKSYQAHIKVNYKIIYLGTFALASFASAAYEAAAKKYFGEFSFNSLEKK